MERWRRDICSGVREERAPRGSTPHDFGSQQGGSVFVDSWEMAAWRLPRYVRALLCTLAFDWRVV